MEYPEPDDVVALKLKVEQLEKSHEYFSDLLAVIHSDGGHYQVMHGDEKASVDAIFKVNNLRSYVDRLANLLEEKP